MASGKPAARPLKPLVMWLGSNGMKLRCPPFLISAATDTTSSTSISKPKNRPASRVETPTPRIIISTHSTTRMTDRMPHGMFQPK
jgi:hypothetical protein